MGRVAWGAVERVDKQAAYQRAELHAEPFQVGDFDDDVEVSGLSLGVPASKITRESAPSMRWVKFDMPAMVLQGLGSSSGITTPPVAST